jgi:hypothetical protein
LTEVDLVVAQRFHAAIVAGLAGVPTLTFGADPKLQDVVSLIPHGTRYLAPNANFAKEILSVLSGPDKVEAVLPDERVAAQIERASLDLARMSVLATDHVAPARVRPGCLLLWAVGLGLHHGGSIMSVVRGRVRRSSFGSHSPAGC